MADHIVPVKQHVARRAHVRSFEDYQRIYRESIDHPDVFWRRVAGRIDWFRPFERTRAVDYERADIAWYLGGRLNAAYNCIDRHLDERGEQTAIVWVGDEPGSYRHISFRELHAEVCRFANVLKRFSVQKGDRVCIYMPMIPEAVVRNAGLHAYRCRFTRVVFARLFPRGTARTGSSTPTARRRASPPTRVLRGGRRSIPLKARRSTRRWPKCRQRAHRAWWWKRTGELPVSMDRGSGPLHYRTSSTGGAGYCRCGARTPWTAEDPLFILYTSGSTGKPKGVAAHHGRLPDLQAAMTLQVLVFDYHDGEVHFWCTADVGWVTGHTYIVYGPLCERRDRRR